MTVGKKIFLIMFGVVVLFLGGTIALVKMTLEKGSNARDEKRTGEAVTRIETALQQELFLLEQQARRYSLRAGPAALIRKPSEAGLTSNPTEDVFLDNDFQVVVVLAADESMVFGAAYDREAGRPIPLPPAFDAHVKPGSPLLGPSDPRSSRRGFLVLGEKIYLVAALPIETNESPVPTRGRLVVARLLDEARTRAIGAVLSQPFRVFLASEASVPADVRAELGTEAAKKSIAVRISEPGTIAAYGLFSDLSGAPSFIVGLDGARLSHAQFQSDFATYFSLLAVYGLISLLLGQFLTSLLITSRLRRLDGFVRSIGPTGGLGQRASIPGRDEVADLAEALNTRLAALELQAKKSRRDRETIKKSQVKYQSLFEASIDAIFLETFDGQILDCNPAACDLLGYAKEELLKLRVEDIVDPAAQAEFPALLSKLRDEGHIVFESANRKKTGEIFPVEISARTAQIGDETMAVVYVRDLSARKRAESIQAAVYRISEATSTAQSLQELFVLIHRTVTELIPTRNFYIALYDDETRLMSFPYFVDERDAAPAQRRLRRGLTEYVLRTGSPLLAPLPVIEGLRDRGEIEILGTLSFDWLGVPLHHEAKTIGVMAVQNYMPGRRFSEEDKNIMIFVSSQAALAIERVRAQERVQASLKEKEVLIREVHHRVKSNMQLISSLFNLQANELRDARALEMIKECQSRIRSMALVHEKLYQSRDLARIHFSDYVHSLAIHLFHFWRVDPERIRLVLEMNPVYLDINTAIPCGLIINELISNALEHAFPSGGSGEIRIRLEPLEEGRYALEIGDTGIGIPAAVDLFKAESLGLQIVRLLVEQLDGTIALDREGGTRYAITFHEIKLKSRF